MSGIFEGLFGNDAVKQRLSASVRSGALPHAFLIDGQDGSGKRTLAYELAAALSCENKGSTLYSLPCRRCNTCRRILEGSYTDIKELDKSTRTSIGVDAVKDFKEDMFLTSTESEYKIYIIKNAHLLTPQAQNALLTVMEEPPAGVLILLLTPSPDKILTTVKSRAQYITMQRFSKDQLSAYLTENVPEALALSRSDPERFEAVLMRADGCIGRAKLLLSQKEAKASEEQRAAILSVIKALDPRAPYSELYSALKELPEQRSELSSALEELLSAVSDMIKVKNAEADGAMEFFISTDEARDASRMLSQGRLFSVSHLIIQMNEYLTKNAPVFSVICALAAKIKML